MHSLAKSARADSTTSQYNRTQRRYLDFLKRHGVGHRWKDTAWAKRVGVPRFVAHCGRTASGGTVRNYTKAVRALYLDAGLDNPCGDDNHFLDLVLRGLRRTKPDPLQRKLPITTDILHVMATSILPADGCYSTARMAAALIAFYALLRKSNVTCTTRDGGPSRHALRRKDITLRGSTLWVRLRSSKTVQFGQRVVDIPIAEQPGSPICPVWWYKRHLELSPSVDLNRHAFAYRTRKAKHGIPTLRNLTHGNLTDFTKSRPPRWPGTTPPSTPDTATGAAARLSPPPRTHPSSGSRRWGTG